MTDLLFYVFGGLALACGFMTVANQDGGEWASPADPAGLSDLANVGVCPSSAASTSINDHEFQLEVRVTDVGGATVAEQTVTITPTCNQDSYCQADCALPKS